MRRDTLNTINKNGNGSKKPSTKIVDINQPPMIEPVLNEGEPKFLIKTITPSGQTYIRTEQENIVQCKICGWVGHHPDPGDKTCPSCERKTSFGIMYGEVPRDYWRLPHWIEGEPQTGTELYQDVHDMIKRGVVFQKEIEYKIITLWIISTWKQHIWDTYGYISLIGIPESGKTRMLDLIYYLGYRFTMPGCITTAAMIRICHNHQCGLNIDEAHSVLTKKKDNDMHRFVKTGYRKNSTYITADNNDQTKIVSYRNAGFKAMAGEKNWNDEALQTRSICFFMERDTPEITNIFKHEKQLDGIRTRLLHYRIYNDDPPELPSELPISNRKREIYQSIIRTAMHLGINYDDIIKDIQKQVKYQEENEKESDRYLLLEIIKECQTHQTLDEFEHISVIELCKRLGWLDESSDSKETRQATIRLGFLLKDLDLHTKRQHIVDDYGHRRLTTLLEYDYQDNKERLAQGYKRFGL